jgi:type 1 glutamine amidotransferase
VIEKKIGDGSLLGVAVAAVFLMVGPGYAQDSPTGPKIKVLIVDGFSNHDWRKTTEFIRSTLTQTGIFEVTISTSPGETGDPAWEDWLPAFSDYDVVIQNSNNIGQPDVRWPSQVEKALEAYVHEGGGLLAYHSANNAFAHWPEYDRMIGLGWRDKNHAPSLQLDADGAISQIPAGEGENTRHGPRQDTVVTRKTTHPLNQGMPQRWMTPDIEVYTYPRGPAEQLTVLSYGRHIASDSYWPLEWIVSYGRGRVYSSSFGHIWKTDDGVPDRVRCVGFQTTLIRAAQWLATGSVDYPVPADFPTEDTVSLKK